MDVFVDRLLNCRYTRNLGKENPFRSESAWKPIKVARERERQKLLGRLAELQLDEFRETGTFDSTPHFSTIEDAAHQLGQVLSRQVQERDCSRGSEPRLHRGPLSNLRQEL